MTWFYDNFLSSLFERAGINNAIWITKKQTAVCCQYMQPENISYCNRYGDQYNAVNYITVWNGRNVILQYSKKNGCGMIEFKPNTAESEMLKQEYIKHQQQRKQDELNNVLNRIRKFKTGKRVIKKSDGTAYSITEYIQHLKDEIAYTKEDIEYYKNDAEIMQNLKEKLHTMEKSLEILEGETK